MFLNKIDVTYCLVVFFVVCPRLRPFWGVFGELALFWCSSAKRKTLAEQWFPVCPSLEANNSAGKLPSASIPPEIQSIDVPDAFISCSIGFRISNHRSHGLILVTRHTMRSVNNSTAVWTSLVPNSEADRSVGGIANRVYGHGTATSLLWISGGIEAGGNFPAELFASSDGHSWNHCSALSFSKRGDEWSLRAFASMSRNKKFALRACEQRKNLGSTSKRALV